MDNEEITIYFEKESRFAFTPFFYNPETYTGIVGPRKSFNPMVLGMGEGFNESVKRYPEEYTPTIVKRSAFEALQEAALKRDKKLMEKIISEELNLEI